MRDMRRLSSDTTSFTFLAKGKQNVCLDGLDAVYWSSSHGAKFYFETMGQVLPKWTWQYVGNWMAVHWSTSVYDTICESFRRRCLRLPSLELHHSRTRTTAFEMKRQLALTRDALRFVWVRFKFRHCQNS